MYDLIEEFRQPVVDRTVLALLNRRMELAMDGEKLADATRRLAAEKVLERLEQGMERYEGKRRTLRSVLHSQARHIATYVRGEGKPYAPFVAGW